MRSDFLKSSDSLGRSGLKRQFGNLLMVTAKNNENTLNIGLNCQLRKSDFEDKKSRALQFLRCGTVFKKKIREISAIRFWILAGYQRDDGLTSARN